MAQSATDWDVLSLGFSTGGFGGDLRRMGRWKLGRQVGITLLAGARLTSSRGPMVRTLRYRHPTWLPHRSTYRFPLEVVANADALRRRHAKGPNWVIGLIRFKRCSRLRIGGPGIEHRASSPAN
jgi:hypothetical protein